MTRGGEASKTYSFHEFIHDIHLMNIVTTAGQQLLCPVISAASPDSVLAAIRRLFVELLLTSSLVGVLAMEPLLRRSNQLLAVTVVLLALSPIETTQGAKSSGVFQIDLMQYHHENSPYAKPNLSLKDRVIIAVESSRQRAQNFHQRIFRKIHPGSKAVYQEPVSSNEGNYLMEVKLGSPPQTKIAVADTGSDLFWLECNCISCYQEPDPAYDPSASSSYFTESCSSSLCTQLPSYSCTNSGACEYFYTYGDQSTTQGVLASDVLTLGSSSFTVQFGCGEQNQGNFEATDGLVGLGRGPISIISQIGNSFGNAFSYCLVSFYSSPSQTSPLILGDAGGSYSYTPLVYNSVDNTFYYVNLIGILVNGIPLNIPGGTFAIDSSGSGGFILDSGTTITQLQVGGYAPLLSKVQSLINYPTVDGSSVGLDACYTPGVSNPSWPKVTFRFQDVDVALPDDNLFLLMDNVGDYCMAIQGSNFGFGIFGNVQQQNFNIKYDIANSQLGFSGPTTC